MLLIVEAYLANAQYELAGELIRKLLNIKQALPNDFIMAVHIIELLYHYNKFDFDFLEILIQNVHKKIRKLNLESRFLENLFNLFLKISKGNITDHKNLFQLYRTSLPTYSEDLFFKQLNNYIDFASWLDSQIRKQPYLQILIDKKNIKN